MGAKFRLRPGLWAACRRRAGRAGQVCQCRQLRAFTSVCKQLRAFASVCERAKSRLVAFSRANFFFSCSGTFGHVWACSVISCRHFSSFFVILRPKIVFSGMAGNGRLRHWLGREAAVCSAWLPRRARDGANDMTLTLSWPTVVAGLGLRLLMFRTSVLQKRGVCSCWEFQGASQNGGGLLTCSEGQESQQLSALWFMRFI